MLWVSGAQPTQAEVDLVMFNMFSAEQGPLQARECWTAARHFLACGGLFMACCNT